MGGAQVCCRCGRHVEEGVRIVGKNLPMRYTLMNLAMCLDCYLAAKEGRHVSVPIPYFTGKATFEVEVTPFHQREKELW